MMRFSNVLKKLISQVTLVFASIFLLSTSLSAEVFKFENVLFVGENNGFYKGENWTQLLFKIQEPLIGNKNYFRRTISFTIDASRNPNHKRTDLRFANDWLQSYKWASKSGAKNIYLGTSKLNNQQLLNLRKLSKDEKVIAAWIMANSDELIEFALSDERKAMPAASRQVWTRLSKNDFFEKNIRKNLGREFSWQLSIYDKSIKQSEFVLKQQIQPYLKSLNLYDGQIDGIWGAKTLQAIKKFERSVSLFPDGILTSKERILLRDTASDANKYSNPAKVKKREEELTKRVASLSNKVTSQSKLLVKKDETIRRLSTNNKEYQELISNLKKQLSRAEDRLSKSQAKLSTSLKRKSELEGKLNKSLAEISKLKDRISELQQASKNPAKEILIKKLKKEVSLLKTELASLESNYGNAVKERNSLSAKLESQVSKVAELKEKLRNTQNLDDEASAEIKNLMVANDKLQKSLDQAAEDMKSLRTSKQALQNSLDEAKMMIKSLRSGAGAEFKTWKDVQETLPVQQQRFCSILKNFQRSFSASLSSANQIKVNNTIFERDQNIDALIPDGNFDNWVGRIVEIYQTPNLDAGYTIELQCDARFSTGKIDVDGGEKWVATAKRGSRIFNQLSKLSKDQFVVFSGTMVKYEDISNQDQAASYITKYEGDGDWTEWEQYFSSATSVRDNEVKLLDTENTDFMFFAEINYLSQY